MCWCSQSRSTIVFTINLFFCCWHLKASGNCGERSFIFSTNFFRLYLLLLNLLWIHEETEIGWIRRFLNLYLASREVILATHDLFKVIKGVTILGVGEKNLRDVSWDSIQKENSFLGGIKIQLHGTNIKVLNLIWDSFIYLTSTFLPLNTSERLRIS